MLQWSLLFIEHLLNKRVIEEEVQKLMDAEIVDRSTTDWLSPCILVKKPGGGQRLVIDYRLVNWLVKPIFSPLPRNKDLADSLAQSQVTVLSTLDLAQAFLQTELDLETKHKTAFITHHGIFQYCRSPYDLSNSPAIYSIVMLPVLSQFQNVYVDSIVVYSASVGQQMGHLDQILTKLREAHLRLRPAKCKLLYTQVLFLGHIICKGGIGINPEKTKGVHHSPPWQRPHRWNPSSVWPSIIGITSSICAKISHAPHSAATQKCKIRLGFQVSGSFQLTQDCPDRTPYTCVP